MSITQSLCTINPHTQHFSIREYILREQRQQVKHEELCTRKLWWTGPHTYVRTHTLPFYFKHGQRRPTLFTKQMRWHKCSSNLTHHYIKVALYYSTQLLFAYWDLREIVFVALLFLLALQKQHKLRKNKEDFIPCGTWTDCSSRWDLCISIPFSGFAQVLLRV